MRARTSTITASALSLALLLAACQSSTDDRAGASAPTGSASTAPSSAPSPTPSPTAARKDPLMDLDQDELDRRLIAAAWKNDVRAARRLVAAGADVNARDDTVQSAHLIAASEGRKSLLDLTLRHGADLDVLDSFDGTGVIRAAERGHAWIVGRLVKAGADPDHVNNLGWVGLHEALVFAKPERRSAYMDTVRVLVAAGADVRIASRRDGLTPVQLAERHGLAPQAELLRAAERAERTDRKTANRRLLAAARDGDPDGAALALRAGADLEVRNDLRQTPLLVAATHERVAVARLLVALGADPDALDHQHDTPWLVTGVTGSVAMLEALLPARPDLTITNRYGGLSPIPAGERGHVDYIRRVIRTDVDLDHVNDLGWTALLEAVILGDGSRRYEQIVALLVEAGVDTSIADRHGVSALEHARAAGYDGIVRLLERA